MVDPREQELQQELSDCVMNSSWFYCVAGALSNAMNATRKLTTACDLGARHRRSAAAAQPALTCAACRRGTGSSHRREEEVLHAGGRSGAGGHNAGHPQRWGLGARVCQHGSKQPSAQVHAWCTAVHVAGLPAKAFLAAPVHLFEGRTTMAALLSQPTPPPPLLPPPCCLQGMTSARTSGRHWRATCDPRRHSASSPPAWSTTWRGSRQRGRKATANKEAAKGTERRGPAHGSRHTAISCEQHAPEGGAAMEQGMGRPSRSSALHSSKHCASSAADALRFECRRPGRGSCLSLWRLLGSFRKPSILPGLPQL